jgi:hypothetical protein
MKYHTQHLLPPRYPQPFYERKPILSTCAQQTSNNMAEDDFEARLKLGKQKIDALAYGFFDLPLTANSADREDQFPGRAASAAPAAGRANRPEQPQRSYTVQSTSDAVTLAGEVYHFLSLVKFEAEGLQQNAGDNSNPSVQMIMMYPYAQDNPLPFLATLDTGTSPNWIGEKALGRLQIQSKFEAPTEYITFNGKTVKSNEVVDITWYGSPGRKTRITTFRVAKNAPFDVVLGSDLLYSEGILCFNEPAWVLAKKPASKGNAMLTSYCLYSQSLMLA